MVNRSSCNNVFRGSNCYFAAFIVIKAFQMPTIIWRDVQMNASIHLKVKINCSWFIHLYVGQLERLGKKRIRSMPTSVTSHLLEVLGSADRSIRSIDLSIDQH